jgi:hypothetical protein
LYVGITGDFRISRLRKLFGIAPGAPIGGCDPPHPASNAAATQLQSALRLRPEILIALPPDT